MFTYVAKTDLAGSPKKVKKKQDENNIHLESGRRKIVKDIKNIKESVIIVTVIKAKQFITMTIV